MSRFLVSVAIGAATCVLINIALACWRAYQARRAAKFFTKLSNGGIE